MPHAPVRAPFPYVGAFGGLHAWLGTGDRAEGAVRLDKLGAAQLEAALEVVRPQRLPNGERL